MKELKQILIIASGTCLGQIFFVATIAIVYFAFGAALLGLFLRIGQ
jgi:hypothetical protein